MHFSNIQIWGGEGKIKLPTLSIFRPKGQTNLNFLGLMRKHLKHDEGTQCDIHVVIFQKSPKIIFSYRKGD